MTQKNLTTSERPCAAATSKPPADYHEFTLSLLSPFENVRIRPDADPKITTICAAFFPVAQPSFSIVADTILKPRLQGLQKATSPEVLSDLIARKKF